MSELPKLSIDHNLSASRFEVVIDGKMAATEYLAVDGNIFFTHTEVPKSTEGQEIGNALVKKGLAYAKLKEFKVIPMCPFVAAYMQEHPETLELLSADI